jgi:hypothetical protein
MIKETEIKGDDSPIKELKDVSVNQSIDDLHDKMTDGVSSNSVDSASVPYVRKTEIPTTSKRLRKVPIARPNDFLW